MNTNSGTLVKVGTIHYRKRNVRDNLPRHVLPQDDNTEKELNKDKDKFQDVEYGVSYIGGDPCGSKYNDDPFDAASNRAAVSPGFPIDMKKRIEALAEQIKQKQENNNNNNNKDKT